MAEDAAHILVVDDDDRIRTLLQQYLSRNGFMVTSAEDAGDAEAKLRLLDFDLMVLDRMMPGLSGADFARRLRETSDLPILMLTAMGEADERIEGLEAGADDYLPKPFEPKELLLRIRAILKRKPQASSDQAPLHLGGLVFDPKRGELLEDGQPLRLTEQEAALLGVLAKSPGTAFTREALIERTGMSGGDRAVDVQVTRLRRKIEADPRAPRYLQTLRGKGYSLIPD
ncbi:MAG: response regulator [Rhodospirillales bacterium]